MGDVIKESLDICLYDIVDAVPHNHLIHHVQRLMAATIRPKVFLVSETTIASWQIAPSGFLPNVFYYLPSLVGQPGR